jgi:hypothetical protein
MSQICSFCQKPVSNSFDGQWMNFKFVDKHVELTYKHKSCGPTKKCFYQGCRNKYAFNNYHGPIDFDVFIGCSEYTRKPVYVNYCSVKCKSKDDNYLEEIELEIDEEKQEKVELNLNGKTIKIFR